MFGQSGNIEGLAQLLDWVSPRPGWCILTVALATLAIRAALLPVHGIPVPFLHDEFSYLLGGDTFASGRLSNPAHPLAASFESIHILVKPTYASNYQPGQALFLALGQKLFGQPFLGVMISAALMNAALCSVLFGWTKAGGHCPQERFSEGIMMSISNTGECATACPGPSWASDEKF